MSSEGEMKLGIIKSRKLKLEKMNEGRLFESIMTCIMERHYMSEEVIGDIQLQTVNCLMEQIELYNAGRSSSISEVKAKKLMESIYATLSFRLEQLEDIDDSITLMQEKPIKELFKEGQEMIKQRFEKLKEEYELLKTKLLPTENKAYRDTYDKGIAPFFESFDVRFGCQDTPCSIDYPLSNDKMEKTGINAMVDYIEKSLLEHRLCWKFDSDEIEQLAKAYHEGADELLINFFELVLMNAIGRRLVEKDLTSLMLQTNDLERIEGKLEILPDEILDKKIQAAGMECLSQLDLADDKMKRYARQTIRKFIPRIEAALEDEVLDKTFIVVNPERSKYIEYRSEEKMSDEAFKALTEEIREAKTVEDKIKWIKEEIHNVEDLRDLFEADCLFDEEFDKVYESLEEIELALLISLNRVDNWGILELDEQEEEEWVSHLRSYLAKLPEKKQKMIYEAADKIKRMPQK